MRRLLAEQFPQWAGLPVTPVANGGWDNWTFHLGGEMSVRLPSAAPYAEAVAKEHRWLPRLAPQLPLPVPVPLGLGRPGAGYPFPGSVYRRLAGDPVTRDQIGDPRRFAVDLAGFLRALRGVDPDDGPLPGEHNWFRGGSLDTFDRTVHDALALLDVDGERVLAVWRAALVAHRDVPPRWFHGDVAAGNLLVVDGNLAAVIDFGTCGVGDPACDLAAAWTLLGPTDRDVFREVLAVDDAEWARGRGWALWKTLAASAQDPADASTSRVLDGILAG